MDRPSPRPDTTQFGRYELLERLAVGGMAEVFLARDDTPPSGRLVVVKRVLPAYTTDIEFSQLFREEMRLAGSLSHRNIVQLFDAGEVNGEPFLTLEYVQGRDLQTLLKRLVDTAGAMPPIHAAAIAAEVCDALAYAHSKNIIHRDISPGNILLSDEGEVKLADFGIARVIDRAPLTRPDARRGKAGYLSPEQAEGLSLDGRSDIFGVGILLWEMLTAKRLFGAHTDLDVLAQAKSAEVSSPKTVRTDLPDELVSITLRALARNRDDRYPRAAEMAKDLTRFIAASDNTYRLSALADYLRSTCPSSVPKHGARAVRGGGTRPIADRVPSPPTSRPRRLLPLMGTLGGGILAVALFAGTRPEPTVPAVTPSPTGTRLQETPKIEAPPTPETRPPQVKPVTPTAPAATATATALLTFSALPPDAQIQIDARPASTTNTLAAVAPHRVEIQAPNHEPFYQEVRLRAGENRVLPVKMTPLSGTLKLGVRSSSGLTWATVFVDGAPLGTTPIVGAKLTAGKHSVRVENPSLGSKEVVLEIKPNTENRHFISFD